MRGNMIGRAPAKVAGPSAGNGQRRAMNEHGAHALKARHAGCKRKDRACLAAKLLDAKIRAEGNARAAQDELGKCVGDIEAQTMEYETILMEAHRARAFGAAIDAILRNGGCEGLAEILEGMEPKGRDVVAQELSPFPEGAGKL